MIVVLALILVGPAKLPVYARRLAGWVHQARTTLENVKRQASAEIGQDIDLDVMRGLDPRRLDPRTIVREALGDMTSPIPASDSTTTSPLASTQPEGKD